MPIDQGFQKNRKKVGKEKGVTVWGPVNPPNDLGIRGTNVAVDWDLCTGCGVCLKVCPRQLYEWVEASDHPVSEKKAFPARESDCVQCYTCETKCPAQAIKIVYPGPTGRLAYLATYLFFVQTIGGIIYGVVFGPSLGLQPLFYVGWGTLIVALFFFSFLIVYFRREGKPGKEKGLMNTTVLVDSIYKQYKCSSRVSIPTDGANTIISQTCDTSFPLSKDFCPQEKNEKLSVITFGLSLRSFTLGTEQRFV